MVSLGEPLIGYTGRFSPLPTWTRSRLLSPERRHFLARTAVAISATPFAACAYGMMYERTGNRDHAPGRSNSGACRWRLMVSASRSFPTFMIGPFMPAEDIRKYVAMVNQL